MGKIFEYLKIGKEKKNRVEFLIELRAKILRSLDEDIKKLIKIKERLRNMKTWITDEELRSRLEYAYDKIDSAIADMKYVKLCLDIIHLI